MASQSHSISDSDDTDDMCFGSAHAQPTHNTKLAVKSNSSLHVISDSDSDMNDQRGGKYSSKRKRNSSGDSDRTLDPDENPKLFWTKSKKLKQNHSCSESSDTDSDITVDYSPKQDKIVISDSDSNDVLSAKSPKKKLISKNSPKPGGKLNKSLSRDHAISNSDSESEKYPSNLHDHRPSSSVPKHSPKSTVKNHRNSDTKLMTPTKITKKSSHPTPVKTNISDTDDSDTTVDLENDKNGDKVCDNRPVCKYGSRCYRKNPSHLAEFSHPDGSSSQGPSSSFKKNSPEGSSSHKKHPSASPSKHKHISTDPRTGAELVEDAGPLGFLLTKVHGIGQMYNNRLAIHIKDILSPSMGNLVQSAQFNYMTDISWLVAQYPAQFRDKPLLIIHGAQRAQKAALETEALVYDHIRLCQAKLDIAYGTHHTKMMFLQYDKGLRVVIHTSNLIQQDWHQKTQGVWVSPLFPKLFTESSTAGDSVTHFKRDLLEYLAAYRVKPLEDWAKIIRQHDMSEAKVYIIASVPGRHAGDKKSAFGHLKLRKLLQQNGPTALHVKNWPVIGQFSSIGSLGAQKEVWVCGEWLYSLTSSKESASALGPSNAKLQLIYPSKDNVRLSLEGYPAGGSLPYSIHTAKKQTWLHQFLHQWKSDYRNRSKASPHIKTYLRISPDSVNIAWFIVTSANLSKAAWGALEKNASQLMIRSYELGVLFLPQHFGSVSSFRCMKDITEDTINSKSKQLVFPVPYDLPPTEYGKQDRPWVWDIAYKDKPDTNGNMWCPS